MSMASFQSLGLDERILKVDSFCCNTEWLIAMLLNFSRPWLVWVGQN